MDGVEGVMLGYIKECLVSTMLRCNAEVLAADGGWSFAQIPRHYMYLQIRADWLMGQFVLGTVPRALAGRRLNNCQRFSSRRPGKADETNGIRDSKAKAMSYINMAYDQNAIFEML